MTCPHCGQAHKRNRDSCAIAAKAEAWGASVTWANEPDEFEHGITFTPSELKAWLADNR